MTKSDNHSSEQCRLLESQNLLFLCSPEYKLFRVEIWHVGRTQYLSISTFFADFFLKVQILISNFRERRATLQKSTLVVQSLLAADCNLCTSTKNTST
jgi:hypothetical protein